MKKIGVFDIIMILAVIVALVVGYFTYSHFRQTADKQIESNAKILFQVYLRGVTITGNVNPIRVGEKTFISIRNVPYTDLKVVDVKAESKKTLMPNPAKKPLFLIVDDYSQLYCYDIIVTVIDTAKMTKDGAVVGGNKIKIGLPITLEGKDYKFNGPVSYIQTITDAEYEQLSAIPPQPLPQAQQQPGGQPIAPPQPSAGQPQPPMAPAQPQSPANTPVGIKK